MQEIITTYDGFWNILYTSGDFYNKTFNLEDSELDFFDGFKVNSGGTNLNDNSNYEILTIKNCIFNCKTINFTGLVKNDLHIYFQNCTFNCGVNIINCSLGELWISETRTIEFLNVEISNSNTNKVASNLIRIVNNENTPKIKSKFRFKGIEIKNALIIENIDIEEFMILKSSINDLLIYNSSVSALYFSENIFPGNTRFNKIIFEKNKSSDRELRSNFIENSFNKINFSHNDYIGGCEFRLCDFLSTAKFEHSENIDNTELKFITCEFKGYSFFNHSNINFLDIDRCTFDKSSSFSDSSFNKIRLKEAKFLGGAYFDDIKINEVTNESYLDENVTEWKRTLRTIKQELQKTENKIDYGRFRVYEFNAYRKELSNRKLKDKPLNKANREANRLKRDLLILRWTHTVSVYGTDWKKAFLFTLCFGLTTYIALTFMESRFTGAQLSLTITDVNNYLNGMFRFFIITDLKSLFDMKVNFETNSYITSISIFFYKITFVLCKIGIAFGIYETVQSFRKFKA